MCDAQFDVFYAHKDDPNCGQVAGKITKNWQMMEFISDATNFGLNYDKHFSVEVKACLLAAVICIVRAKKPTGRRAVNFFKFLIKSHKYEIFSS